MFDKKESQKRKINKLKGWRDKYSKEEYPFKVIMNMFYELFTIESIWDEINSAFSGKKQFQDMSKALLHIVAINRSSSVIQIHPNLLSFLKNDKVAGGIKYSDFKKKINEAKNGDNHQVIEIEYSYWYYCQYREVTIYWAALGYMGYDKHSAFQAVTGGDVGGLKLDTFKDAIQFFPTVLGHALSWKNADGNSIDPTSNKDKKYYPDSFEILPRLWS